MQGFVNASVHLRNILPILQPILQHLVVNFNANNEGKFDSIKTILDIVKKDLKTVILSKTITILNQQINIPYLLLSKLVANKGDI